MTNATSKYRGSKHYLLVYAEIIRAAQFRGTVTYQEIADIVGLPLTGNYMGSEIGILLGEIVKDELAQDRPMLTAVVVSSEGLPGPGFFGIAKKIGKYRGESHSDKRRFWETECQAVYNAWQRELKGQR